MFNGKQKARILFLETYQQNQALRGISVPADNLQGWGGQTFLKRTFIIIIIIIVNIIIQLLLLPLLLTTMTKQVNAFGAASKRFSNLTHLSPSLNAVQGSIYFTDTFKRINCMKVFKIPSLMPKLKESNISFNLSPPSYQEIKKLHELSSAWNLLVLLCPLYQISIICSKQCPYLRSFMWYICTEVPRSNTLPAQLAKIVTILIHKKGDPSLPENFKPITLEPLSLKIFTSLLRNRVFMYLINNQFIESHY